jgi:hypothetical protein
MAVPRGMVESGAVPHSRKEAAGTMRAMQSRNERQPHTFVLDQDLVERARREVGERDVVRSIEAALAAAIDYNSWVREVREGRRDVFS